MAKIDVMANPRPRWAEFVIEALIRVLGFSTIGFVLLIFLFLLREGVPAFFKTALGNLLGTRWYPTFDLFGTLPLILGSALVTMTAIAIALPLGVATAVFVREVAPGWAREILKPMIEVLAGIPSVVLGFFGMTMVAPLIREFLGAPTGLTAFTGALVLAYMALPTVISVAEDALDAVPKSYRDASLAMGATQLQTIWRVVVPAARSGILTAVMLGMGRAIGETMAVMMVTGNAARMPLTLDSLFRPARTMTATIAATIAITGFLPAPTATVWTLNGADITAYNDVGHPTDVSVTESVITDAAGEFVYAFPAHSVTLIELELDTPPASECVGDFNPNGIGDIVDIMTTSARPGCWVYLPLAAANWRQPWPSSNAIVLTDGPGGLELVSAPATVPITVGHVTYLPVEVQGYHRPITVSAQTLIHTYVNDATLAEPGDSPSFVVGTLQGPQEELKLQTLRMRSHAVTLTFTVQETRFLQENGFLEFLEQGGDVVSTTLTIQPALQPRAPLFGAGFIPACPDCYWGGLSEPYTQADGVYGNDCQPCAAEPGEFRPSTPEELECIKRRQKTDPTFQCRCRLIRQVFNAEEANRIRTTDALAIQRYASQGLRHQIGWSARQPYPTTITNTYLLEGLDWIFQLPPQERDYSPLINDFMEGIGGWMSCPDDYPMVVNTGSGGSIGFYDENNAALVNEYRLYVRELAARFGSELRFLETMNEPCYGFYLCPCRDQPPCNQTWPRGPDHQVCDDFPPDGFQPHQTQEFADAYGEFLFAAADIAAEELQNAGSDALLVAGALELTGAGLTKTTEKMIRLGLLERDNVALMIHQFPYPGAPNWIEHEECVYGPGWSLPPGCETAPPLQDYRTPAGRDVLARDMWRAVDEAIDVSEILSDVAALSQEPDLPDDLLSRFYLFDSELHGGFGIKDETTNAGRTAIAGLRIGAINAHQRFAGLLFIGNNTDPAPYNVMVRHLTGTTPVYRWDAPLIGSDYVGLVYKLFTRGNEDIIAIWSNAATTTTLNLALAGGPTQFKEVTLTRIFGPECPTVDCRGLSDAERTRVDVGSTQLSSPPSGITVAPLQEFYFLSVISDRPGFGWLTGLTTTPLTAQALLPFAINGFYIPWKVAQLSGIDTPEELEAYLVGDKVPYFSDLGTAWGRVHPDFKAAVLAPLGFLLLLPRTVGTLIAIALLRRR